MLSVSHTPKYKVIKTRYGQSLNRQATNVSKVVNILPTSIAAGTSLSSFFLSYKLLKKRQKKSCNILLHITASNSVHNVKAGQNLLFFTARLHPTKHMFFLHTNHSHFFFSFFIIIKKNRLKSESGSEGSRIVAVYQVW